MSYRGLGGRVRRVERETAGPYGRCADCPPIGFVEVDADGNVLAGAYPEPCAVCGGPYDDAIRYIQVVRPDDGEDVVEF